MADTGGPFGPNHPDYVDGECHGFAWIGQSLAHCDNCGDPYWVHRFDSALDRDGTHGGTWWRKPITPEQAAAVRARHEITHPAGGY